MLDNHSTFGTVFYLSITFAYNNIQHPVSRIQYQASSLK